jgi:hypothetical protein
MNNEEAPGNSSRMAPERRSGSNPPLQYRTQAGVDSTAFAEESSGLNPFVMIFVTVLFSLFNVMECLFRRSKPGRDEYADDD